MMKSFKIPSSKLPEIDEPIRNCINHGQWLLFRSGRFGTSENSPYFLKAGHEIFRLDSRGTLIEKVTDENFHTDVDEVFYFSDISQPESLSNAKSKFI